MAVQSSVNFASDSRFLKRAMKAPLLEQDHELDLARRWRDHADETST